MVSLSIVLQLGRFQVMKALSLSTGYGATYAFAKLGNIACTARTIRRSVTFQLLDSGGPQEIRVRLCRGG